MTDKPDTHRVYLLTKPVDRPRSTTRPPEVIFQVGKCFTSIFRVSGIHHQPGAQFTKQTRTHLLNLVNKSGCRLQFLHSRLPFDKNKFQTSHAWDFAHQEEYIRWVSDYVSKWFARVGDHMYEIQNHVVLSEAESELNKPLLRRRKNFEELCKSFGNKLNDLQMQPMQLTEQEAQEIICQNPVVGFYPEVISAKVAQGVFKAGYVSALPDEIWDGWLLNLSTICGVFSLSVSIEPVVEDEKSAIKERIAAARDQLPDPLPPDLQGIVSGKEEPVSLCLSYSATGATAQSTAATFEQIENIFTQMGATCQANADQVNAAPATLPLGQIPRTGGHSITSSIAAASLPILKIKGTETFGTPLGTTLVSAEPVYLPMDAQGMDDLLIVAEQEKQRSALLSLLSLRYLSTGNKVVYIGAGRSISVPIKCLSANAHKVNLAPTADMEPTGIPSSVRLLFFSHEDLSTLEDHHIDLVKNALDMMDANTMFVVESASAFADATELLSLINTAKANNQPVILADSAKTLSKMSVPAYNFKNILAFEPDQDTIEEFEAITGINPLHLQNFSFANSSTLLYANFNGACDILHFITSPLEACMLQYSHRQDKEVNFEERLKEKIESIKAKNPRLSDADSVRQGVYYLAMEV